MPALTKYDVRVLKALAAFPGFDRLSERHWLSAWEIAELVREDDVRFLRSVLRGLEDRHLAMQRLGNSRRGPWWTRTHNGQAYLEEHH